MLPLADREFEPSAAQLQYAVGAADQPLGRRGADTDEQSRLHDLDGTPRKGRHISVSWSVGVRLPGGRQNMMLVMKTDVVGIFAVA